MGLGLIRIETFLWIRSINPYQSEWIGSIRMIPKNSVLFGLVGFLITSDWPDSCGLILINSDGPDTFGLQGRINFEWASDWFELKLIETFLWIRSVNANQFELSIKMNLVNPNDSEKFRFIRIDFEWASDWFELKNNFGLDRNETVWYGYKFRNDS